MSLLLVVITVVTFAGKGLFFFSFTDCASPTSPPQSIEVVEYFGLF